MAELLPAITEVEGLLTPPTDVQVCHRDLWADNVRATPGGELVVLDWENCGPASPTHELAMVAYEYGAGDAARVRALHRAYADAGGPGRLRDPADATMLVAQQLHILQVACERWLASGTEAERADNEAWAAEFLDDPVTVPVVEWMLDAVR
jgi:thiamine kinase-like enzyme